MTRKVSCLSFSERVSFQSERVGSWSGESVSSMKKILCDGTAVDDSWFIKP